MTATKEEIERYLKSVSLWIYENADELVGSMLRLTDFEMKIRMSVAYDLPEVTINKTHTVIPVSWEKIKHFGEGENDERV